VSKKKKKKKTTTCSHKNPDCICLIRKHFPNSDKKEIEHLIFMIFGDKISRMKKDPKETGLSGTYFKILKNSVITGYIQSSSNA
jgi:hypothetical protein